MVYCCRPSKNCLGCRQRRIRCDLQLPACSQCKRAGMKCSGYRDQASLLFRDENVKTQQRSAMAKDRSRRQKEPQRQDRLALTSGTTNAVAVATTTTTAATKWLSSCVDDRGLRFFIDRFTISSHWGRSGHSTIHPYIRELIDNQPVRESLVAIGLAALTNATGEKACHTAALQKYATSINFLRRALQDPVNANVDVTITILVSLSIYEFVSNRPGTLGSWKVHIEGALAFLRQTSKPSLPDRPREMPELQSYLFVAMKYFTSGGNIPGELLTWTPTGCASSFLNAVTSLIDTLVRFVRAADDWRHASYTDSQKIIHAALLFDKELEDWEASLAGDKWTFVTKESNNFSSCYQGKYHVYANAWAYRTLNHYRWSRILVNEILYLNTLKLATPTDAQIMRQQKAVDTICRLAADICFSVPNQTSLLRQETGEDADGPAIYGILVLVLPLMIAGSACGIPDEMHDWVIMMLGVLGSYMGIRFAAESIPGMKQMRELKKAGGSTPWVCPVDFSSMMRATATNRSSSPRPP
ncbi:hypothetical protein PISL3812_06593 [Talaromyces islandicus]|uniref:Zn(2)-C6 fungal-type domain-containing protein n=1 Tax=Talaromyces islandicus TaxID=28573 RepID=A0A0U1M3D5_TALIS|nr:hypothetical protein PISL3812_06593 [Talaromyces islandicus]